MTRGVQWQYKRDPPCCLHVIALQSFLSALYFGPDVTNLLQVMNRGDTVRISRKCQNNQYFLAPGDTTQYCKERCVETKCGEFKVPESHLEVRSSDHVRTGWRCTRRAAAPATPVAESARLSPALAKEWRGQISYSTSLPSLRTRCHSKIHFVVQSNFDTNFVSVSPKCWREGGDCGVRRPLPAGGRAGQTGGRWGSTSRGGRTTQGHTNICPRSISTAERAVRSLTSTLKVGVLQNKVGSFFALFNLKHYKFLCNIDNF